jgi:hypothetical protein
MFEEFQLHWIRFEGIRANELIGDSGFDQT